jgi:predicted RNase H-like HicB family nuclease
MSETYTVILRPEPEGGYTVLVPALPGCVSYGATIGEALRMAEEAVTCHVEALKELGKPVPEEGPDITFPAKESGGTMLVYRVSAAPSSRAPAGCVC